MGKIKNIIFDYGNVIFAIDFKITQNALSQIGITDVDDFFGHKGHHNLFDLLETGAISTAEFRDRIRSATRNNGLSDQEIDQVWNSLLIGIDPKTLEELAQIKEKYRTFLLSNTNQIHFDYIMQYLKDEFQVPDNNHLFEKAYYSHEMKLRKPHIEIFQQVLQENNLDPAETLFIDDSPQHLVGAKKAGLHTLLMTEKPKNLGTFLKQNGIDF